MRYEVTKGQRYRHYKGSEYKVTGMVTHTETKEGLVTYVDGEGCYWARPVEMFFGYLDDGRKRFTAIEEDE